MAGSAEEEEEVEKSTECAGQAGWAGVLVERTPLDVVPGAGHVPQPRGCGKVPSIRPGGPGWVGGQGCRWCEVVAA